MTDKTLLPDIYHRINSFQDISEPHLYHELMSSEIPALLQALETALGKLERAKEAAKEMRWFIKHGSEYPTRTTVEKWDQTLKELEE